MERVASATSVRSEEDIFGLASALQLPPRLARPGPLPPAKHVGAGEGSIDAADERSGEGDVAPYDIVEVVDRASDRDGQRL